jgi:hypothetical protein
MYCLSIDVMVLSAIIFSHIIVKIKPSGLFAGYLI